jgi:hypothetical protein
LSIPTPQESYKAGKPLNVNFYINSFCGEHLKIFPQQLNKYFRFRVNGQTWDNNYSYEFDTKSPALNLQIKNLVTTGRVVLTPIWKNIEGANLEINMVPGEITKYDICDPTYDQETGKLIPSSPITGQTFTFTICSSDQFKNPKMSKHTSDDQLVKIEYPNLIPASSPLKIESNIERSRYKVTVPLTGLGTYSIYNEQFFGGNQKFFDLKIGNAASETSYGEISNYFENRNAKPDKQIILYIHLKDFYGNNIPSDKLKSLNCSLEASILERVFQGVKSEYKFNFPAGDIPIMDGYPSLLYTPHESGQYTFRPRVKCDGDKNPSDIKCDLCTFYIATSVPDNTRMKIFSDYKNQHFFTNEVDPLFISLDENQNRKLTTLKFVDTSGMELPLSKIDSNKISAEIFSNGETIKISAFFNPVGIIELFTEQGKDRTSLFSPLIVYKLVIKINDANFKLQSDLNINVQFTYKDDYLNNISTTNSVDVPENFIAIFVPGSFKIRASSNQLLFRIVARNSNNELTMGNSLDVSKVSLVAYDSEKLKFEINLKAEKIGIFLYVSGSPTKAGTYTLELSYDGKKIQTAPLIVTSRYEVESLKYDEKNSIIKQVDSTSNTITLNDYKVGLPLSLSLTLLDEFSNVINDNYLSVFNSISIKTSGNITIQPLLDGTLTVFSSDTQPGESKVSLTLPNGKSYTIKINRFSNEIDASLSSSELIVPENSPIAGSQIQAKIILNDNFGNDLGSWINSNESALKDLKDSLLVYIVSQDSSIVKLSYDSFQDGEFIYSTPDNSPPSNSGEYSLKVFYKNVPVTCLLCHINIIPSELDLTKTTAFMIGYKSDYRLYSDNRYQVVSNKESMSFYLIFKDRFGNEVSNTGSSSKYEIALTSEDDSKSYLKFCVVRQEKQKRQYYQICSGENFSLVKSGKYLIKIESIQFKVFVTSSLYEAENVSVIPSAKNTYLRNENSVVLGSVDIPARMVIDFRSENFLRYINIDTSKIKISSSNPLMTDFSLKILYGPHKGLVTALISSGIAGSSKLTLSYSEKVILSDIIFTNKPGNLANIQYLTENSVSLANGKFYFFQLTDKAKNKCDFSNVANSPINDYLLNIFSSNLKGYITNVNVYNAMTGILSVKLEKKIVGELKFDSLFLPQSITVNSLTNSLDFEKSFGYLNEDTDTTVGSSSTFTIQTLDSYSNILSINYIKGEISNFSLIVATTDGENVKYLSNVKPTVQEDQGNQGLFSFTYKFTQAGEYLFVPLYKSIPIDCNSCKIKVSPKSFSLSNTTLQIKSVSGWHDKTENLVYTLFKHTYPVLKLTFRDENGFQLDNVDASSYRNIIFSVDDGTVPEKILHTQIFKTNKNGIFIYLTEQGRSTYLSLKSLSKLKLRVENSSGSKKEFFNFILLNSDKETSSNASCANDAVPTFSEMTGSFRAGSELFLDFSLTGCLSQQTKLFDSDFTISSSTEDIKGQVIPCLSNGKYILILTSNESTEAQEKISVKFKDSKLSQELSINVYPEYSIGKLSFSSGGSFTSLDTFASFKVVAYDNYQNIVNRDNRLFFTNDIFVDLVDSSNKKIPYKVTYSVQQSAFMIQFPILYWDNFTVKSKYSESPFIISVGPSPDLYQTLSVITKSVDSDRTYDIKLQLRDIHYKSFEDKDLQYTTAFNFEYFTYNYITGETYNAKISDIKQKDPSDISTLSIRIPSEAPVYQYAIILPYSNNIYSMVCATCVRFNNDLKFAYTFKIDDSKNKYSTINLSSSHYLNNEKEKLFWIYESSQSVSSVSAKIENVEIQTISYDLSSGSKLNYSGFDSYDSIQKSSKSLVNNIELKLGNGQNIQIYFDNNEIPSNSEVRLENVRVHSSNILSFNAGGKAYFYVEVRDKDNKLTSKSVEISLTVDDIIYNVIKTSHTGLYLVEVFSNVVSQFSTFGVKINSNPISGSNLLKIFPAFPSTLDVNTQTPIDWATVQYNVVATDSFNNPVCDRRLSMVTKMEGQVIEYDIFYDSETKVCRIWFYFSGVATLTSPLFKSDANLMKLENISQIKVSSFSSQIILDQNNSMNSSPISIVLKLVSNSGYAFPSNTNKSGVSIRIYSLNGYSNKLLVNEITAINTLINSYTPETLGIKYGNYLISAIVDGNEIQQYSAFKYYKSTVQEPSSIEVDLKLGNQSISLDNVHRSITLPYPFSLMLNYINSDNQKISIPKDSKIVTSILMDNTDKTQVMSLEGIRNSETSFLITVAKDKVNLFLHLPKGNYIISITCTVNTKKIEKIYNFYVEKGLFQNDNLNLPYSLPGINLSQSLDLVGVDSSRSVNTNVGSYSRTNLCLKSGDSIYNEYLDPNLFKANGIDSSCTMYSTISLRGCIEFSLMCSKVAPTADGYKVTVYYNNVQLSGQVTIFIDPQLPPTKVEVLAPFSTAVFQKSEIVAKFNLKDSAGNLFKYVNAENFEIFVNNEKLSSEKWKLFFNQNLQLKIMNVDYPPRKQNIQVLFKDTNGGYTRLNELNTDITVSQGSFDSKKTLISLPVSYYAGDPLSFIAILRDSYTNCYEDDVDASLFSAKVNQPSGAFSEFSITQEKIDFVLCKRIIKITTKSPDSPLKTKGTFKMELSYNNTSIASSEINVLSNKLSPSKSTISITGMGSLPVAQVQAGSNIEILMTGTDAYSNPISYLDTFESFDLDIPGLLRDADYFFSSRIDDSNSKIIMSLRVNVLGSYHLNYTLDSIPFESQNGLRDIVVVPGKCSVTHPNIKVPYPKLYTGDHGEIEILCLDDFGNAVSNKGDEFFNIEIKGRNLEIVGEDKLPYQLKFNNGIYSAEFLLAYQGVYDVNIFLNGHRYGDAFNLTVLPHKCPPENPIMCSDKSCVDSLSKCIFDTDSNNCADKAKPFYCKVNGEKTCVAKTTQCDCSSGFKKCNGICLPEGANNICITPVTTNCQRKLGVNNFVSCPDGSCRTANSKCPNPLGCPLGYKPCGVGCINRKDTCTVKAPECKPHQVKCWDLTCANSIDNCPTGKTCKNESDFVCPDGKCVEDSTQCTQPPTCNEAFNYLCPDFTCKKSADDCSKRPVCFPGQSLCENNQCAYDCAKVSSCPSDKYLCPTGQCVANAMLCPTPISCPSGFIKCPSGSCAQNFDQCKFVTATNSMSCPLDAPILCTDLSCVTDTSLCQTVPKCPPSSPFRCPNNECRRFAEDCPSTPVCPAEYPVLCSDGTCQKASYHCSSSKNQEKCDKVRCYDGSCVNSISLCPNHVTCGPKQLMCWDGSCVNDVKECRDPKYISCPESMPFRCPDGSCRINKASCSTISICPKDRPVKCYDGSCRENISLCPVYQPCGKGMKSCPDGTCSADKCNTIVTCPSNMPFLCYDNTCKSDIRDCPVAPSCNGIVCPDGSCASNRQMCKFFEPCPPLNPVRCQQGSCAGSVDDCYSTIRECPIGFVKCKTGGCRANESLCPKFTCPANLPFNCPEGTCVEKQEHCDSDFGCPFHTPSKCADGTCVKTILDCGTKYSTVKCIKGSKSCPDGSCRKINEDCPLPNGCTKEKPLKCADGVCIDPLTSNCAIATCPFEYPIKCANGECVKTSANCPSAIREQDFLDCEELGFNKFFMCADGRCVPSPSYCRPLYSCPNGYVRCSDGTCKLSSSLCPASTNCPVNRPTRCPFGKCVSKDSECYSNILCPHDFPIRCDKTGECVKSSTTCPGMEENANGCPAQNPFKCHDGRCMKNQEQCSTVNIACLVETPVLCPDGTCKSDTEACKGIKDTCADGYERCPDGTCVEKSLIRFSCKNIKGCPLVAPLRCANGECVSDLNKCKTTISCSAFNPVLCADKSCVADSKFCNVLYPCPTNNPFRCGNGYCTKDESSCKNLADLCPLSSPIKCPTGKCVQNIIECSQEFNLEICKDNEFFCATSSSCVSSAASCVGADIAAGTKSGSVRLLSDDNVRNQLSMPVLTGDNSPENGCPVSAPYSCYDGTCRAIREECPLLPACNMMEYRCPNGSCQKDPSKCKDNNVICEQGFNKCEDGLCRKECPSYNGCGLATPFQCTNGMCVKNPLECVGYSMCPRNSPFRCMDGNCVAEPNSCPPIKRLSSVSKMTVSVSKFNEVNLQFAFDRNRRSIAKLYIPGNSINITSTNSTEVKNYTNIYIDEIPHSSLYNVFVEYNNSDALTYNVSNALPASDGVLGFENSVLSPIFKISGDSIDEKLAHLSTIQIEHNYYLQNKFLTSDYCLAKLMNKEWICVDRKKTDEQTYFVFDSFGIYAVVLNPLREYTVYDPSKSSNFFFDNLKTLAIVLASLFLISIIIFYIFTRVIRYREKYKDNKEKMINMQNQLEELKNMSTDVPGQTLGDNIAGIVFTRNPAHSVTNVVKGSAHDLENEIEEIQRKCRAMENQNRTMEDKIQDISETYKMLKMEIDRMKR